MNAQNWISVAAILSAVVAYFAKNFIFEPLLEYRSVEGRIQNKLKFYANKIFNTRFSDEVRRQVSTDIRQLSCDLEEKYYAIAFHELLSRCRVLPSNEKISEAARGLMFISSSIGDIESNREKHKHFDKVVKNLGIVVQ